MTNETVANKKSLHLISRCDAIIKDLGLTYSNLRDLVGHPDVVKDKQAEDFNLLECLNDRMQTIESLVAQVKEFAVEVREQFD